MEAVSKEDGARVAGGLDRSDAGSLLRSLFHARSHDVTTLS